MRQKMNELDELKEMTINELLKAFKLGLVPKRYVIEELEISSKTLRRWELKGLKRYAEANERNRKIWYKREDIFKFLGG